MKSVVLLSGSPSPTSRTNHVLQYIEKQLADKYDKVTPIFAKDLPIEDLFYANFDSPEITALIETIEAADGILIASPIYKAAYTGVLKMLFDILPQHIFAEKVVLPIMLGGSRSHLLALEYTLKPIIAIMKGQSLRGVYILDNQIDITKTDNPIVDADINRRIKEQLTYFNDILQEVEKRI